jgi:branched-chain amino acid transport system substrate-binding protein
MTVLERSKKEMKNIILVSVAALLVGCVGVERSAPQPVRVGALLPLSGKKAPMGIQQRHALEMAQERLKTEHGVEIEVIFEDTRSDAKVGEQGARRLIEEQGVSLVLAFPCDVVYKTQPIADRAGALLMACNMDPITTGKSPRTFRVFPHLRQQNDAILEHLGKGGGRRAGIVRLKAPSPDNAMRQLLPALKSRGWNVVADVAYDKKVRDYEGAVARLKALRPDVVLMFADNKAVPPLLRLLKKEPSLARSKILGGISFAFRYKLPPQILEGVTVAAPSCALSHRSRVVSSWLGTEFRKRHGKPPHMFAAFCFDTAMVLGHALKEKGSRPADVQAYLSTVTDYSGVTGRIALDKAGDAQVAWGIGVYRNGKLVPVSERK